MKFTGKCCIIYVMMQVSWVLLKLILLFVIRPIVASCGHTTLSKTELKAEIEITYEVFYGGSILAIKFKRTWLYQFSKLL
jgi:hypothetical protein